MKPISSFAPILAILLIATGVALADDQAGALPTVQQVLSQSKEAVGGAAWDGVTSLHITSSIESGGLSGKTEEWDELATGRNASFYTLGPASGGQGFDGSGSWTQDQTGASRADSSEDDVRQAISNAYLVSLAYWYPDRRPGSVTYSRRAAAEGKSYDVLEASPTGGWPIELWFDVASHQLDREVEQSAEQTVTTTLSDYRAIPGTDALYPWRVRSGNGKPQYDQIIQVQAVTANEAVDSTRFAMPAPPVPAFEIRGGARSTTIPMVYMLDHVFVPIKIDGHPYLAYLDTGGAYVMTTGNAKQLGLEPKGHVGGTGEGDATLDTGLAKPAQVEIGAIVVHKPLFIVAPLKALHDHPIIGFEVLERFVTTIDYDRKTVTFTLPEGYAYRGHGVAVPMMLAENTPEVMGSIDGIKGYFTIDTGSGSWLDLSSPFVKAQNLAASHPPKFRTIGGWGVGGPAWAQFARARTVTLGEVAVHDSIIELNQAKAGAGSNRVIAGNIGEQILHRFNLTFDYTRHQIIFEKNSHFDEPNRYSGTGILVDPSSTVGLIADVIAGGPGARAGVKVGDLLVSVNGIPLDTEQHIDKVRRMMRQPSGTHVKIVVRSRSHTKAITLVLTDLV